VALLGMGEVEATDNTHTIFKNFRLKAFILGGYGGALVPPLKVGQVVVSTNFSTEAVLGFLRMLSGFDFAAFCTAETLAATPEQRDAYAREAESQVVDMETAGVTEVVQRRAIPFLAVRAISDDYHQTLPTGALAAGFDNRLARATPFKLLAYLLTHPREIGPFRKFVSGLGPARRNLTKFLVQLNHELPPSW